MSVPPEPQQPPKDAATWTERITKREVKFAEVVRFRVWQELMLDEKSSTEEREQKQLGEMFYESALGAFKKAKLAEAEVIGGELEIAIFAVGCGAYVTPDGRFWYTIIERAIDFNWSRAHRLLARVQSLYDRAAEIWPVPVIEPQKDDAPKPEEENGGQPDRTLRGWLKLRDARRLTAERDPHARRAYELCTSLFSAINLEKLRRGEQGPASPERQPSAEFEKRVEMVAPEIAEAETKFDRAAQRYARGRYGQGMVLGVTSIGLLCCAMAVAFDVHHVPAWYGVAPLAGGVGATVSVLQRMATGKLKLEYDAGDGTLLTLGAVRPVIGAIFGTVLFCAVEGGWLSAVDVKAHHELAFYAVLGFLAGFNERFAQDMLVASAAQVSHRGTDAADAPPGAADAP